MGKRTAQFELYNLYVDAMYQTSYRMVGNTADAEDVVQDAFVKAFTKLESFQYKSTFGAWLKRIVINQSVNFLKAKKLPVCTNDDITDENTFDVEASVEIDIIKIKKAIKLLSDGYRRILSLYLLEGYDHSEISQIAGISVSTSKSQFHRAKKKLVDIIKKEEWKS